MSSETEGTAWPPGGGEMARRVRGHDWASTPLGPSQSWPQSLRTTVEVVLAGGFPMVALWGPELVQVYNDGYRELMEGRHPRGLGQPTRECWPEVWGINAPIYERVRAGETVSLEDALYPIARAGGLEDAWYTLSYGPLRDEGGGVAGVLVTVVETTARVRADAALREREERDRAGMERQVREWTAELRESRDLLQATMDASMDMIQVFRAVRDARGEIVDFRWVLNNHTSESRYGEVLGQSLLERNPGVAEEGIFDAFRRVVETGEPIQAERRYVHEEFDGWFFQSVVKLGDGVATTTKDITAWKEAQEEVFRLRDEVAQAKLRESEERHRLIVESARDYAILTTDPEGRIESWSPGAEAVFGWSEEEAVGRDVGMTFTDEDRAAGVPEEERAVARSRGVADNVRWHRRRDGGCIFIEGTTRRLDDAAGGVRGFLKIGQDVTRRRRAEEALRELNESLERRVAERTAALAAEVEERGRAEESRREVLRRLVTAEEDERRRISRELHDQMGQLVTALQLGLKALERGVDAPVLADLERLAEQVAREVHEVAVSLRPPALDRLGLRRTLQAHLEEWAARYGVACDFQAVNVDGERFPAEVETTLFRTVQEGLTNVARHAGAARVSLILERRPGSVGVILEDDGRGFDVETAAAGAAGAGRVGLLGMRERVELLGGTLEVESGPGSGTTLFARLPDRPGRGTPPAAGEGA